MKRTQSVCKGKEAMVLHVGAFLPLQILRARIDGRSTTPDLRLSCHRQNTIIPKIIQFWTALNYTAL